jgi:hypothetical protein
LFHPFPSPLCWGAIPSSSNYGKRKVELANNEQEKILFLNFKFSAVLGWKSLSNFIEVFLP